MNRRNRLLKKKWFIKEENYFGNKLFKTEFRTSNGDKIILEAAIKCKEICSGYNFIFKKEKYLKKLEFILNFRIKVKASRDSADSFE
jgi:hypothetical protein